MKGLEALKEIENTLKAYNYFACKNKKDSFNTIEKELKALDIISQLFDFKYFIEEWYKRGVLPQEEYDLLKEVLL